MPQRNCVRKSNRWNPVSYMQPPATCCNVDVCEASTAAQSLLRNKGHKFFAPNRLKTCRKRSPTISHNVLGSPGNASCRQLLSASVAERAGPCAASPPCLHTARIVATNKRQRARNALQYLGVHNVPEMSLAPSGEPVGTFGAGQTGRCTVPLGAAATAT